jgi:hypothetical protein
MVSLLILGSIGGGTAVGANVGGVFAAVDKAFGIKGKL